MAKKSLEKHLRANPKAKKHEGTIRDTLKILKQLKDFGVTETRYDLGSPYGGNRDPRDEASRKVLSETKMTYCA